MFAHRVMRSGRISGGNDSKSAFAKLTILEQL
jgi:hypothetical protein